MFNSRINSTLELKWILWTEIPACTVLFLDSKNWPSDSILLSQHFHQQFESLIESKIRVNRFFIIVSENNFEQAQNLLHFYETNVTDYQLTVEVCDSIENRDKFDYTGLDINYFSPEETRFAILALTPSRKLQARRLGVYSEDEADI